MAGRILIIDDDPFICEYLKDRLEAMGYQVMVVHDGRTALALMTLEAKRTPIHGVLLDLHMPIMDGLQTLRELRAHDQTVPVVVMTADPDQRLREEARALGASHHIGKPIDLAQLAQICEQTFPLNDQTP